MKTGISRPAQCVCMLLVIVVMQTGCSQPKQGGNNMRSLRTTGLPYVDGFEPSRYLGKWYEAARLSTPIQPDDTLATAEYALGQEPGSVIVKNTSYNAQGQVLSTIEGQAQIASEWSPGSLLVAFGPVLPKTPNYQVIYIDNDYRYAVVGSPNRQSMWILVREVPVSEEKLAELRQAGTGAGFDLSRLIVAPWKQVSPLP